MSLGALIPALSAEAASLRPFFRPRSIAILGASQDPTRIGGRPLKYLVEFGFAGSIYPINPKHERLAGLACYPSLEAVPGEVDLALIALPAAAVPEALAACVATRAKAVVLFSAGFGETGTGGREAERALGRQARTGGLRLLGPNCLGSANLATRAIATFASSLEGGVPVGGNIGFVGQSGAFGAYFMAVARERRLPLGLWATTGNEADVQLADVLAYMAVDPAVAGIAAYIEGCRDGLRLRVALELARRHRKPVVVLKAGTTPAGQRAALSHTGALVGDDVVYDAVFEEAGAVRVRDLDDLIEFVTAAALGRRPTGPRVGILTVSGGAGILMADCAVHEGLVVPELSATVQQEIRARVGFAGASNPVDATGQVLNDPALLHDFLRLLLSQEEIEAVVAFVAHVGQVPSLAERIVQTLVDASSQTSKLILVTGMFAPEAAALLSRHRVALFTDPVRCVRALAALARLARAFRQTTEGAVASDEATAAKARALVAAERAAGRRTLPEGAAKTVLRLYGVPALPDVLVREPARARHAAASLGPGPFAVKLESADLTHRTDIGAVRLGVALDDVAVEVEHVLAAARRHAPHAVIDGVLITPMLASGVELCLGARLDPTFGPVVMGALGGVFVEVLKDVALHTAPLGPPDAARLLARLRAWPLLAGVRGHPRADVEAAAAALAALSRLAADLAEDVAEVEVNPLVVYPAGAGAQAADALITLKEV